MPDRWNGPRYDEWGAPLDPEAEYKAWRYARAQVLRVRPNTLLDLEMATSRGFLRLRKLP